MAKAKQTKKQINSLILPKQIPTIHKLIHPILCCMWFNRLNAYQKKFTFALALLKYDGQVGDGELNKCVVQYNLNVDKWNHRVIGIDFDAAIINKIIQQLNQNQIKKLQLFYIMYNYFYVNN